MDIERVKGHAYHSADRFSLCGMYLPLVVNAVNYHLIVNALENNRLHNARKLGFFGRNDLYIFGTDNDIDLFINDTYARELGATDDDIYAAIEDSIKVSVASYNGTVKLLEMKGE